MNDHAHTYEVSRLLFINVTTCTRQEKISHLDYIALFHRDTFIRFCPTYPSNLSDKTCQRDSFAGSPILPFSNCESSAKNNRTGSEKEWDWFDQYAIIYIIVYYNAIATYRAKCRRAAIIQADDVTRYRESSSFLARFIM